VKLYTFTLYTHVASEVAAELNRLGVAEFVLALFPCGDASGGNTTVFLRLPDDFATERLP
jgi:hypothetical protein